MKQLHKKFTDEQVKELLSKYADSGIARKYIQDILGIGKTQFFNLLKDYRKDPKKFSIEYKRKRVPNKISQQIEGLITRQLKIDKQLIADKNVPIRNYNYSYIKDEIERKYNKKVSVPTIIDRAKKKDFYLKKRNEKVMTEKFLQTI